MTPSLTVVIPTRSGWPPVERTLGCLAEQTVADRIELVLVTLADDDPGPAPASLASLAGHRVVRAAQAASVSDAYAAGVRHAAAPVVVLGEDHAFPLPDWAEVLLARHDGPWAVVGPVVRNANPGTSVSWADYTMGYGAYAEGTTGGEVATAPGHNSSYKRAVLARHDTGLERALDAEWVFHLRLRDEGERIYLEPRAVIRHVNFGVLRPWVKATYRHARAAAGSRAAAWSPLHRLVYVLAAPLIPPVRLTRILRVLPAQQRRIFRKRAMPLVLVALVIDGAAQAVGFARPGLRAGDDLAQFELERLRFIPAEEAAGLP